MARYGPITKDTTSLAIGMAQIRVLDSATNIAERDAQGSSDDSIGAMASTTFRGNTDWYKKESGFPMIEDFTTPIREAAALECAFEEISPANMALAFGHDPLSAPYSGFSAHSGEVKLGGRSAPDYVRMEAVYTYPNGTDTMTIIFPRAQVSADIEMPFEAETASNVTVVFESKNASSDVDGGNAVWDDGPLGRIVWA